MQNKFKNIMNKYNKKIFYRNFFILCFVTLLSFQIKFTDRNKIFCKFIITLSFNLEFRNYSRQRTNLYEIR